jgi:hypothetical protein
MMGGAARRIDSEPRLTKEFDMTRATLALAVPAVAAALAIAHPAAGQPSVPQGRTLAASVPERVIASSTAHDFRINLVAKQTSGDGAPSATVWAIAYDFSHGTWHKLDQIRLSDGFFWDTVTGQHAIRDFTITNNDPRGGSVRLLETPALGWSHTFYFHLHNGRFAGRVAG